ncbi:alkaline phosphatase [Parasegetibacter sp. NRK P23]|uniref:alkaline phosphatase n=1 Tax=Parasegetibacter sp. NRK P23 TaxID=2942999 RepID=UPI0020436179|nr:alkaline phosphatase [Parasegetibacter sp. NRK P23]MCM5529625.1 alkaline phosphatase [Parasegetibacter sp. NRK P23]
MKKIVFLVLAGSFYLVENKLAAQQLRYTPAQLHAHNDYEKAIPFWNAYHAGFGSIEADIFLEKGALLVAHEKQQLNQHITLEKLYLAPLDSILKKYNGNIDTAHTRKLQLLIDIKTEAVPTLDTLIRLLEKYPRITGSDKISIVISGNRPPVNTFTGYPSYLFFDGVFTQAYDTETLKRIALFSDNLKAYTRWNGMGIIPAAERKTIDSLVSVAHRLNKKIRFWNAPDIINTWYQLMRLHADWINTDHVTESAFFMNSLPMRSFQQATPPHQLYQPLHKNDGAHKAPKNIILLIGDGTSFPQWYAGYTANHGALNVFSMKYTGISKTSSFDSYITDSAPGSTAFATGEKTNNRSVGVDHTGAPIPQLPALLKKKGMRTALITSGDISDATPADFYAHQAERSSSAAIIRDLQQSGIDLLMGSAGTETSKALAEMKAPFKVISTADSLVQNNTTQYVVVEKRAGTSMLHGRGAWLAESFKKATEHLTGKQGFFMMLEAAQIDHGGHANNLPYLVTEVLDFDQTIAQAMAFADTNGETLVIVTGDHETGGLTLLGGDYKTGFVAGQFATTDHTALPVPVFAYGPGAQLFTGTYENTEVFHKILKALNLK